MRLADAVAIRRALAVSGPPTLVPCAEAGESPDGVPDVRACVAEACTDGALRVWPPRLVAHLLQMVTCAEAASLVLTADLRAALRSPTECWLLADGLPLPLGDGEDDMAVLSGLLLVQRAGLDGLVVAALLNERPQLVSWWPDGAPLGDLLLTAARQSVALGALLAASTWALLGCAATATGAVTLAETVHDGQPLSVVLVPDPPGTTVQ